MTSLAYSVSVEIITSVCGAGCKCALASLRDAGNTKAIQMIVCHLKVFVWYIVVKGVPIIDPYRGMYILHYLCLQWQ